MTRPLHTLIGAGLLNAGLGTFYAWSVFVAPFESLLGASRTAVSSVFSLATACFVVGMLVGPRLYGRIPAPWLAGVTCTMATAGLLLAAGVAALPALLLGYGVLFGLANGIGYGMALQLVSRAFTRRRGLVTGTVVAAYAAGAAVAAPLLTRAIDALGLQGSLYLLAGIFLALVGITAAFLRSGATDLVARAPREKGQSVTAGLRAVAGDRLFRQMWLAYVLGAGAGLMMIGHAAGLVAASGATARQLAWGPVVVSLGNGLGRLAAGWLGDLMPIARVLTGAGAASGLALLGVYFLPATATALVALCVVGTGYGLLAAGYPVAVAHYYGPEQVGAVYGKLFTAWGVGGVLGPWIAGEVYDLTGAYGPGLFLAGVAALFAAVLTHRLSP